MTNNTSTTAAVPTTPQPPNLSCNFGPPQPLAWLFPDRIPLGRITLFLGPPESGKTSIALDLANRLATGHPWPDAQTLSHDISAEPGDSPIYRELISSLNAKVAAMTALEPALDQFSATPRCPTAATLILTPFENASTAISPRLYQLNPNPTNLFYCSDQPFNLPLPSANLPAHLRAAFDSHPNIKLLIMDPIIPMLNLWPKNTLPAFLQELSALAHTANIAILATAPATNLAAANSPLAQLCSHATAIYQLSFDSSQPANRNLQTIKFPGQPPPALTVELAASHIRYLAAQYAPSLAPAARPGLHEDDPSTGQMDFAVEFLRETLSLKPMTARKILQQARSRRIAPITLHRAKALLGVRSYRLNSELSGPFWVWSITGQPDSSNFNFEP